MNFRPQNKASRRILIKRSIFFASLMFVLVAFNISHFNPFSSLLNYAAEPFWKGRQSALVFSEEVSVFFRSNKSLAEENRKLRKRIAELERTALIGERLFKENEELKTLLGRDTPKHTILAAVLARPALSPYDTFIVDVGRGDGVLIGDRVIVDGTFVIGEVSKVFQKTAQVKLFSTPGEKINVTIGPSNLLVTALGQGGGNFKIVLPRGVEVKKGDVLTVPDINVQVLGVVEEISMTPSSSFQTVYFKNLFNMAHVQWVQIIRAL